MTEWLQSVPAWMRSATWTALTIGAAWCIGHLLNAIVITRLGRLIASTRQQWGDAVASELRRRVPLWSVLVGAYASLAHWQLSPEAALLFTRGLFVVGAVSATLFAAAVASRLIATYGAMVSPALPVTSLTQSLTWVLVVALGALVVLSGLGVSITPMLTAMGVGGLAIALALQEPLANLFAGLFVSMAGQVRIGDNVKLDSGVEGKIVDFNWRSTWLEVPGGSVAVVPNSKLSQSIVTNFNLPNPEMAIPVEFTIRFEEDPVRAERTAIEVAQAVMRDTPGAAAKWEPTVRFHTFADLGLRGTVTLRAATWGDQGLIRHRFLLAMHDRFRTEGIELVSTAPVKPAPGKTDV